MRRRNKIEKLVLENDYEVKEDEMVEIDDKIEQ